MRLPLILWSFLLLAAALPLRAEGPPLAMKALERLDETDEKSWSYTRTTRSKDGTRVERHDATRPEAERWILVSKDGRTPTAKERRDYAAEKAERRERRKEKSDDEQDIDPATIRLVRDTADTATFSFGIAGGGTGLEAAFAKSIRGTLVVRKEGEFAERFEIRTAESIRPIPGLRIDEFRIVMTYRRDAATGSILPDSIESRVRGRAFMVKSLDDETVVRFSDFERP